MAWLLLALPVILLLLLLIPLRVQVLFSAGSEWKASIRVHWLFWLMQRKSRRKKQKRKRSKSAGQKTSEAGRSKGFSLTPAQCYQLGSKYVPRFWRALHLRCDFLDVDLLFSDPSLLGYTFAICGMNDWPKRPIRLSAAMAEEFAFDLEGIIQAKLYPIECIVLFLRVALEPPVRQLWWRKRKGEVKNARTKDSGRTAGKHDIQQDSNRRTYYSG